MKLALWSALVVVSLAGCGKKKEDAATASGSGTGAATATGSASASGTAAPADAAPAVDAAEVAPDAAAENAVLLEGLGPEGSNVEIVAPAGAEGNAFESEDTGLEGRVTFDKVELTLNKPPEMGPFEDEKKKLEKDFKVEWIEADADGWAAIYGDKKGKDKTLNVLVYRKPVNLVCYAGELATRADADAIVPVCRSLRAAK